MDAGRCAGTGTRRCDTNSKQVSKTGDTESVNED
jgi:hypothetical protein